MYAVYLPLDAQVISTVAGNGNSGFSGDNGPATSAEINPIDMTFDSIGNMYIVDNARIRKVDLSGTITTIAGNGTAGYSGDGGPATLAEINPSSVSINKGNIYIAEVGNNRVRVIYTSGIINTIAGNGVMGYSGDGGPATSAELDDPSGVAFDKKGNLYIADSWNNCIRKVNPSGIITTVVGNGNAGYGGDGGQAILAELNVPTHTYFDSTNNMYIADWKNNRIRKVDTSGIIQTIAGNGTAGYSGDGGQAINAKLDLPTGIAIDKASNVFIVDKGNERVRKVTPNGIITTIAGNGITGYSGDGGPATSAELYWPYNAAIDALGNLYIADSGNNRIRKISKAGVGINYLNYKTEITIYPNPSNSGDFHLKSDEIIEDIAILNSLGQNILHLNPKSKETHFKLEFSGIYLVVVSTAAKQINYKIQVNN